MGSDPLTNEMGASLPAAVTKQYNFNIPAAFVDAIGHGVDASLGTLLGKSQRRRKNPLADLVPAMGLNILCVALGNPAVAVVVSEAPFANLSDTLTMRSLETTASAGHTRYLLQTGALHQRARKYLPQTRIPFSNLTFPRIVHNNSFIQNVA